MYTFQIIGDPPMSHIMYNDVAIDISGPWQSVEAATSWAEQFCNLKNAGLG